MGLLATSPITTSTSHGKTTWSPVHHAGRQRFLTSPTNTPIETSQRSTLERKWDRAISDTVIKSGLGFSFGVIFSVLLFKRRAWPVWFGTGFGAGRAWEAADAI